MKRVLRLIGILAVTYSLICAVMFFAQRKFLYFPPDVYLTPAGVNLPQMQEVEMRFGDESWATAWWMPPSLPDSKIIMVFHGNGSAVFSNHDIFRDLIGAGYGVWSVGYPGYPEATGVRAKPSQMNLVGGASAQYDALIAKGYAPEQIIFYGTSLGSGVAAQLAAHKKPSLLIMDAPFNSILDMGRKRMPWLPVSLLMKDTYRSDAALENLDVPLIWIHGTRDRIVPLSQGQKLYDGYEGQKTAHIIEGGQHTNLWYLGGREIVLSALEGQRAQ